MFEIKSGDGVDVNVSASGHPIYNSPLSDLATKTFIYVSKCPSSKDDHLIVIPKSDPICNSYPVYSEYTCRIEKIDYKWAGEHIYHIHEKSLHFKINKSRDAWTVCIECGYRPFLPRSNQPNEKYLCRDCATKKGIMPSSKFTIGDRVLCRVRPKKRIVFDDPYSEGRLLERRAFEIIGDCVDGSYIVLVDDPTLGRWPIENHHLKEHKIDAKFKGKFGYNVFAEAIGGIAPRENHCKNCKQYNNNLKNMMEAEEAPALQESN